MTVVLCARYTAPCTPPMKHSKTAAQRVSLRAIFLRLFTCLYLYIFTARHEAACVEWSVSPQLKLPGLSPIDQPDEKVAALPNFAGSAKTGSCLLVGIMQSGPCSFVMRPRYGWFTNPGSDDDGC
jgi:hypothetical protein